MTRTDADSRRPCARRSWACTAWMPRCLRTSSTTSCCERKDTRRSKRSRPVQSPIRHAAVPRVEKVPLSGRLPSWRHRSAFTQGLSLAGFGCGVKPARAGLPDSRLLGDAGVAGPAYPHGRGSCRVIALAAPGVDVRVDEFLPTIKRVGEAWSAHVAADRADDPKRGRARGPRWRVRIGHAPRLPKSRGACDIAAGERGTVARFVSGRVGAWRVDGFYPAVRRDKGRRVPAH